MIRQKLEFARTDILRLANAAMRMSQFATTRTPIASSHGEGVQIGEPQLMLAIRCWERQVSLYIAHAKWDMVNAPRLSQPKRALLPPRQPGPQRLSIDDLACYLVLGDERCRGEVDLATARVWVRHKLSGMGSRSVAGLVRTAVLRAATAGVVRVLDEDVHSGGHPAFRFCKRPWSRIEACVVARDFLASVRLDAQSFPEHVDPPSRTE